MNQTSLQMTENQDFFTRLEKFSYLKSEKEKLNKTCQEIELVDPETGVEFFKPQICRAPKLKVRVTKREGDREIGREMREIGMKGGRREGGKEGGRV